MKKTRLILSLITAILLFGSALPILANNNEATIIEKNIEYTPEEQVVHVGQRIHIINNDPFEHKSRITLQHDDGSLGYVALKDHLDKPGASYQFKLKKPGTYEIRCMLHDGMTAIIKAIK